MLVYSNIKRYDNLPFKDYLQLPGLSHSTVKSMRNGLPQSIAPTEKMRFGSMVDDIISGEPVDIFSENYRPAQEVANELYRIFPFIDKFQKQVSFTATIEWNGLAMETKGRPDWLLPNKFHVDLKVTSLSLNTKEKRDNYLTHFRYENALFHYAKLAEVPQAYLLSYSRADKKCWLFPPFDCTGSNLFWENALIDNGVIA